MNEAQDRSDVSVVGPGTRIERTVVADPSGSRGRSRGGSPRREMFRCRHGDGVEADIDANSITLAGQVKGDLTAAGDVTAPADSRLAGNTSAQNVEVGGAVNGEIVAIGRVRLGPRARVTATLHPRCWRSLKAPSSSGRPSWSRRVGGRRGRADAREAGSDTGRWALTPAARRT